MEEPKAAPNPPTATANAAAPPQQPPPTTKRLVELYKQMLASVEKSNNAPGAGGQTLQVETGMKQKPQEQAQVVKPAPAVLSKTKILQSSSVTGKLQADVGEAQGTYIVGGSAFGWNFITFTGNQPVYYGVTKESFRSAQASSGLEGE
ncbi:BR-signaling kinase 3 [Hibiscus syriacus]|uniref:BR-signaling kinase 3 n=1 Tax=Hibiscus syriacus TaxID=106335 RepID=A0A6A2XF58_HIBSY|nr:BR-signaling kinase 3 [Hibiscus syriacus]